MADGTGDVIHLEMVGDVPIELVCLWFAGAGEKRRVNDTSIEVRSVRLS